MNKTKLSLEFIQLEVSIGTGEGTGEGTGGGSDSTAFRMLFIDRTSSRSLPSRGCDYHLRHIPCPAET